MRPALLMLLLFLPTLAQAQQITIRQGAAQQQVGALLQQMQQAIGQSGMDAAQQRQLQRGLVGASLYSCTEQAVGKEAVDALRLALESRGKEIEAYCKSGQAEEARSLALATLEEHYNAPAARAAKLCYYQSRAQVLPLLDKEHLADLPKYERWAEDPGQARRESTARDICKGSPQVVASPAAPVSTQTLPAP